jgi:hypothetical protein
MDGMVNELQEKRRGFFAEETNLEAWDSIAAHSKGLEVLARLFRKNRQRTTTDALTIPYRNGILHGMDLGYDNNLVAAKTWAALFATRDWAIRAERGLITEQPQEPQKTWGELLQQVLENADNSKILSELLESWSPRLIKVGEDIPSTGESKDYAQGTPENALADFLCCWKQRNYGRMASFFPQWLKASPGKDAGRVRDHYSSCRLNAFEIKEIEDKAPAITEIKAWLGYEGDGEIEREVIFRLVNEDVEGNPTVRGKLDSRWSVTNWGHGVR